MVNKHRTAGSRTDGSRFPHIDLTILCTEAEHIEWPQKCTRVCVSMPYSTSRPLLLSSALLSWRVISQASNPTNVRSHAALACSRLRINWPAGCHQFSVRELATSMRTPLLAVTMWLTLVSAVCGRRVYFGVVGGTNLTSNFPTTDITSPADVFGNPASRFQYLTGPQKLDHRCAVGGAPLRVFLHRSKRAAPPNECDHHFHRIPCQRRQQSLHRALHSRTSLGVSLDVQIHAGFLAVRRAPAAVS